MALAPEHQREHADYAAKYTPVLTFDEALVQKGMPSSLLTDLYYHMLRGSWLLVLLVFSTGYLLANVVFAGLYLAGGDCIAGATPGDFGDAFFFSVETLSTIGYGNLSPKTRYGELVMTAEAMTGVLGVALATGLIFSKFSRPSAKLAFSQNIIVAPFDGQRCLYFRVANLRGNDVVEATVGVAVALDYTTTEGHTMRRLEQLKLSRNSTPLFRMSWLIIHVIDEDSPLYGLELEDFYADRTLFVVTLTGMDGTFAQAVNSRHLYKPEDVAWDHHFVDIMSVSDAGLLHFNFEAFHDLDPLDAPTGEQPSGPEGSSPVGFKRSDRPETPR